MDGVVVDVDDRAIAMLVMELIPDATLDENAFLQVRDDAAREQAAAASLHEALAAELPQGNQGDGLAEVYAFLAERMRPEDFSRLREEEEAALRSASRRTASLFAEARVRGAADEGRRLPAGRPGGDQERLFAGSGGGVIFPFLVASASASAVASLEKVTYDGGSGDGGTSADCTCCAICIQDYEAGDELSVMPCAGRHRFHRKCLGEWLPRSRLCPLCRHALPAEKMRWSPCAPHLQCRYRSS